MSRLSRNPWWALILAATLGVAGIATLPPSSVAAPGSSGLIGDDGGDSRTPNPPDPNATGDPDSPASGPAPTAARPGAGRGRAQSLSARGVGDSSLSPTGQWVLRVRLAMRALRVYYLRF